MNEQQSPVHRELRYRYGTYNEILSISKIVLNLTSQNKNIHTVTMKKNHVNFYCRLTFQKNPTYVRTVRTYQS